MMAKPFHIYQTKEFVRWARRHRLAPAITCSAADEIHRGLLGTELGDGLLKKRIPRAGQGKRGGFRVLVAHEEMSHCVFMEGLAKSDRENFRQDELKGFRRLAIMYRALTAPQRQALIDSGEFQEIMHP